MTTSAHAGPRWLLPPWSEAILLMSARQHWADSKTGPRSVFLNKRAKDIADRRMTTASGEFLFPSPRGPTRPISDDLTLWKSIRREAGIEDVRLHDLRLT
ncbi:MAG: hypothetical protein OXI81_01355 [Paracoccaceae bacterium]|nr:hypothetical protein [Paracoccaceae bacterium]